jgi:hypothetical protein
MSFFDRLFGAPTPEPEPRAQARHGVRSDDERAVERYRYLLETAPPEAIEQVHAEAFAKLTPEQRRLVFAQLTENAPTGDAPRADDPQSLAHAATRSELRQPGTTERSLAGPGFGQMLGASLLGTVAGYVVGSALVSAFLPPLDTGLADAGAVDAGADPGADGGAEAFGDAGGGFADFGDFGF